MTTQPTAPSKPEENLTVLLGRLSLEDKVRLLTGGSAWATVGLPMIGLSEMVLSDGPSGVRGALWDERDPSLCLPSATALSASWDVDLARRYGAAAAVEARRKGVAVILGPTVNLHRSPLGGRHFEAFSEDPVLTADLAAAYVGGVQQHGVAATLKHYVANDFETDRYRANVTVGERPLRELYLLAFERGVREAGAWCVMSAYNAINGVTATENPLLSDPLTTTWGFDGVVMSDWTAVRSLESARQPQDLAMPGPDGPWGPALVQAVRAGEIEEELIDRKVTRLLRLAERVGALPGSAAPSVGKVEDGVGFARTAAAAGMVLVRNDGSLPIRADRLTRIAVIGDHAVRPRIQGGGSATVIPEHVISPLAGLRAALPDSVQLEHRLGAAVDSGFTPLDPERLTNPHTGRPGARLTYYDADGAFHSSEERFAGLILDFAAREGDQLRASLTYETRYRPAGSGDLRLGFASPGHGRLWVDGRLVLDEVVAEDSDQVQNFFLPPFVATPVRVTTDVPLELRWEFTPGGIVDGVPGSISVTFGTEPNPRTESDDALLISEAVDAARAADVVVVVVGTTAAMESEGYDRTDLRLPGRQDELVAAVAAANPATVVVVNAGAPVEMPWRNEVAAVLLTWFGGQEYGHALADVLLGVVEPGGRLPTTWPARLADAPVTDVTPRDGVVDYAEGLHIGYKAWLRSGVEPAYSFGYGLGYTRWAMGSVAVAGPDPARDIEVEVGVTNVGERRGKQVVQVYARRSTSRVERPGLWLVGFTVVYADPGEQATARIAVSRRALAHWDDGDWHVEHGPYELLAGFSVAELADPMLVGIE